MNEVIYYLLNKLHGSKVIDNAFLEKLFYFYIRNSELVGANVYISRDEFDRIISVIWDVLKFRLNDDEFLEVITNYLSLLVVDAKADNIVDVNWFIKYIWYLGISSANSSYLGYFNDINISEFNDCIPFVQKRLIEEFAICEKRVDKVKRKIYINIMCNK